MKTLSALRCVAALAFGALTPISRAAATVTTVTKGQTVTFDITIKQGSAPLKYYWYHNGTLIGSTTVPRMVKTNIGAADGGSYTVRVVNAFGETISNTEIVFVRSR